MLTLLAALVGTAAAQTAVDDLVAGDLIVTEAMVEPVAVAWYLGQWFEVYNASGGDVDLYGLVVSDDSGDTFTVASSVVVAAGEYAVFAANSNSTKNGGIPYVDYRFVTTDFALASGADEIVLSNSYGEIDRVELDGGVLFPAPTGASISLSPDHLDADENDDGWNWCDATTPYGDGDYGTPGSANDPCAVTADDMIEGDLIITEILSSPTMTAWYKGQWFEVYNASGYALQLYGLTVTDDPGTQSFTVNEPITVEAGGYAVFASNSNSAQNGGLPQVDFRFSTSVFTFGTAMDAVAIEYDGLVIDQVVYDNGNTFPDPTGASMSLCEGAMDAASNNEGGNWIEAQVETYGLGDFGTPGSANEQCATSVDDLVAGDLLVSEIFPYPTSVGWFYGQWFEIYNASGADVDIYGLMVSDADTDIIVVDESVRLGAGEYALFAVNNKPATNGELPTVDYWYSIWDLVLTKNDELYLDNAYTTLDTVDWAGGRITDTFASNVAQGRDPDILADYGTSTVLYDWCDAASYWGTGYGTPGDVNDDCDIDFDSDGYVESVDCDDMDDTVTEGYTWYADADSDGYGDAADSTVACDQPSGYVDNDYDCDDTDAGVGSGSTWYADADSDGYGDAATTDVACDQPSGYTADDTDCDDTDGTVNPGAEEVCDGVDNNCDGSTDEGVTSTFYADADADGYGDASSTTDACDQPSGYVTDDTDCDDTDAAINPAADEVCDGADNNCDGTTDTDAIDQTTWYADADTDGYGDAASTMDACDQPSGYVTDATDCDDTDGAVNPGAAEVCDEADNNCDGNVDEGVTSTFYADADADGYGDASSTTEACSAPSGYTSDDTDCDDTAASVNPGADEYCDTVDNDCDGEIDESGALDESTFYADADSDGYGDAATTTTACDAPTGYVTDDTDCDDTDVDVNPGADEYCTDGIDNDCDGSTDEDDAVDAGTWYADADSDGYGDETDPGTLACDQPTGTVADNTDCDDGSDQVYPGATEIYDDGIDQDCDGSDAVSVDINWCTVQWPLAIEVAVDEEFDVYGQVYSAGVTDSGSPGAGITAEWGYGDLGTDPSSDLSWTFASATFNTDSGNNDEYMISTSVSTGGYYDYAFRFSGDGGSTWTYCDTGGSSAADTYDYNEAGLLQVGSDADGDLYVDAADGGEDCDDTDPDINPDMAEVCDSVDNNCDGNVDEGVTDTYYVDADSDGYGDETDTGTESCDPMSGYVTDNTDCDDTDGGINPGETDIPDNGIDEDCDGSDATNPTLTVDDLVAGDLVFTEVMPNPDYVSDFVGEYFEFVNTTGYTVDLDGLQVWRSGVLAFTVSGMLEVADGTYVVFGNNNDPGVNGGYTPDYVFTYASCTLTNTGLTLALANTAGTIDTITYGAGWGYTTGVATGLDPAKEDATLNDTGSNWCAQSTEITAGGDLGTPGAASDCP